MAHIGFNCGDEATALLGSLISSCLRPSRFDSYLRNHLPASSNSKTTAFEADNGGAAPPAGSSLFHPMGKVSRAAVNRLLLGSIPRDGANLNSSVAQWWSGPLLTGRLGVRVPPGEKWLGRAKGAQLSVKQPCLHTVWFDSHPSHHFWKRGEYWFVASVC